MVFKAGDSIVHPRYGVGSVVRLEEKCLAEDRLRLYYMVAVEKSTVWVRVDEGNTAIGGDDDFYPASGVSDQVDI